MDLNEPMLALEITMSKYSDALNKEVKNGRS